MVLFTTILVTVPANAAPVNLICKAVGRNSPARQVTIDESRQTASFAEDAASTANFTETKVKWFGTFEVNRSFSDYAASFLLDRVTGILSVHYENLHYSVETEFGCTVTGTMF
jgi:hypothetical protein